MSLIRASSLPFSRLNRQVIAVGIADTLAYRGSFFLQLFFQMFPLVTQLLLWGAVFGAGGATMLPGGFDAHRMLSYYLLMNVLRVATFVEDVQWSVTGNIKDGQLNKYLIRPVNYVMVEWHLRMGTILVNTLLVLLPAAALFFFARGVMVVPAEGWRWGAFALSVVLGIQVGFLISLALGLCAFWILETTAFMHALFPIQLMLSGGWFPLELLPPKLYAVIGALPWAWQSYFPMKVYLGQADAATVVRGLGIQLAWVAGLALLCAWLWSRGIRKYGAVGG